MIETFITIMTFASFDDCWTHFHQNKALIEAHTDAAKLVCVQIEQELPPMTVLRPKLRPEGLGQ